VSFGDAQHVWAVGDEIAGRLTILASSDGGLTWRPEAVSAPGDLNLLAVSSTESNFAWAVGVLTKEGIDSGAIVMRAP
jgi:photosystem II stability/assembly factor-like uncharacterized protein